MDIREKIDTMRIKKGWSRAQLAYHIGASRVAVDNWYKQDQPSMPSVSTLENLCSVFGITMAQLFSDVDIDRLSERQICVLELFSRLSESGQNAVIEIIKSMLNS